MKKLLLLIAGMLVFSGTAMADCSTCEGTAEKAKHKAASELKADEKIPCALKKDGCKKKSAEERAVCPQRIAKEKALLEKMTACEKAATCEKETSGKKWYNPVSWFK